MIDPHLQKGIGLIEVMLALALIVFTALTMGHLQTSSLVSAKTSSVHFSIDRLSSDMLETLRSNAIDAEAGLYNFDGSVVSVGTAPVEVSAWVGRVESAIRTGVGSVDCMTGYCEVSISWMEELDGSLHRQFYRARTPL